MQPIDPFAAPITETAFGMQRQGGQSVYPEGYYRPITSFDLGRMLAAPFKSPNWPMNLLWMFVCQLASVIVVGSLVMFGYQAEVAESRSGGRSEHWPDFNPDRFSDYLMRGLWPFLWSLIWTIPLMFLIGVPALTTIFLSSILLDNNNDVSGVIVIITGSVVSIVVYCFAMVAMLASVMHAGLGNDFQKGADIKWIGSYVSKMGRTTIWVGIVFVLISLVANTVGFLLFCVGIIAATPFMNLVVADLYAQLHDIFVSRGGVSAFETSHIDEDIIEAQVII